MTPRWDRCRSGGTHDPCQEDPGLWGPHRPAAAAGISDGAVEDDFPSPFSDIPARLEWQDRGKCIPPHRVNQQSPEDITAEVGPIFPEARGEYEPMLGSLTPAAHLGSRQPPMTPQRTHVCLHYSAICRWGYGSKGVGLPLAPYITPTSSAQPDNPISQRAGNNGFPSLCSTRLFPAQATPNPFRWTERQPCRPFRNPRVLGVVAGGL
ncbi:hypothetical protein PG999_002795 [Apiospora kogelbergensis]|uniref:Uncharacterized protein n=1 Tax=Apiospora kogelbergensis TaxID=1337665 RepID=A0AAW0R9H1_9PEZI